MHLGKNSMIGLTLLMDYFLISNYQPLIYNDFRFLIHARTLFMVIMVTYYENIPDHTLDKHPDMKVVEKAEKVINSYNQQIEEICDIVQEVWRFALPAMTRDPEWEFDVGKFIVL